MTELEKQMLTVLDMVWLGIQDGWLVTNDVQKLKEFLFMMTKIQSAIIQGMEK